MSAIPTPEIHISCLHYDWGSIEQAFDRAQGEFGLDGIEFSWPHPLIDEAGLSLIRSLSAARSVPVAVHVWGDIARLGPQAGAAQMRQWLHICRLGGFGSMVVHGGSHDDQQAGIDITRTVLQDVVGDYERAGVVICLENHYAYDYEGRHELFSTPEEFRQVFDAIPSPCLGFLLDYGHSEMTSNTEQLLEALAPRLVATHIADNMGEHDDHLAFGEGVVQWREMFGKTRQAGFPGPYTVEFPVREPSYSAFGECVAMLREVYR